MRKSERSTPPAAPQAPTGGYEPPVILWEQAFVALAQTSIFDPCTDPSDPNCTNFGPGGPSPYE